MKTSGELKNLAAALVKVQAKLKPLARNAANPFFKKNYTDLAHMSEILLPMCAEEGLCVIQGGDGFALETMLLHTSGEWVSTSLPLPQILDPQKFTAGVTYIRRSGLACITGATSDNEDDDGNTVADHPTPRQPSANTPANTGPSGQRNVERPDARPTPPAPAAPTKAQPGAGPALLDVKAVDTAEGEKDGKKWKRFTASFSDGTRASTFHENAGAVLAEAKHNGTPVRVTFEKKGNFTNILTVEHFDDQVPFGN